MSAGSSATPRVSPRVSTLTGMTAMTGVPTDSQGLNAQKGGAVKRGARKQIVATLSGAVLLFFCLLAIAITWYMSFVGTLDALEQTSLAYRRAKAKTLSEQIAVIVRPTWSVTRQFVDRLSTTSDQDGYTVFPPLPETFSDREQLAAFSRALAPSVNTEVFLRTTNEDMSETTHNNFVSVVMVLALDEYNQPATSLDSCTKAVWAAFMLDSQTRETYSVEVSFLDPAEAVPDPAAPNAGTKRQLWGFNSDNYSLPNTPAEPDLEYQYNCSGWMASLWGGQEQLEDFYNFTYYGPYNPGTGWGNLFEGSVPIYNDQQEQVGRVSSGISMGQTIGPILNALLADSPVLKNGVSVLYTESGLIMGLSEGVTASDGHLVVSIDDLSTDSLSGMALAEIREVYGTVCPRMQEHITRDDHLVDVTPFYAQEYGMPPLPERWCHLVVLPRENVYEAIDNAVNSSTIVGIICLVGFLTALVLLGGSMYWAVRSQLKVVREKRNHELDLVKGAEECITTLMSPMVLVHADDFLGASRLECYEVWRNRGLVRVLDSIEEVSSFKEDGNLIAFLSHQWLGEDHPDNSDNLQLQVMQSAIREMVESEKGMNVYVWVDYICIAQRHTQCQALAVSSLPAYVSVVDRFVIVAPTTWHTDTHLPVGLATYKQRGWCRAEMLAKACSSGVQSMYICAGELADCRMHPFTEQDMGEISLSVYEGDFTEKRDAEKLVMPVLGLYSLILRNGHEEHLQWIKAHIEANKESFFPYSYRIEERGKLKTKRLFGDLVPVLEKHVVEERHSGLLDI